MSHDVFISYDRRDLAAVKPIREKLKSQGFSCRMYLSKNPCEVLDRSCAVLFFLSRFSQKSKRAVRILLLARELRKPVLIVRFNDDIADDSFSGFFDGSNVSDCRGEKRMKQFIAKLERIVRGSEKRKERRAFRMGTDRDFAASSWRLELAEEVPPVVSVPGLGRLTIRSPRRGKKAIPAKKSALKKTPSAKKVDSGKAMAKRELCRVSPETELRRLKGLRCIDRDIDRHFYRKGLPELPISLSEEKIIEKLQEAGLAAATFGMAGPPDTGADLGVGVVAPETVPRGDEMMVQVVVERYEGLSAAIEKAKAMDAGNHAVERGSLPVRGVRNGAEMAFRLEAEDLQIDAADRIQKRIWDGMPFTLQFFAAVPDGIRKGMHSAKVLVSVDGIPVGRIGFAVNVTDVGAPADGKAETAPRGYREYFASYSDKDLERVVPRIQGLRSGGRDVHVFFDKLSLRSGDRYEKEIFKYIDDKADAFLLFWSANSAVSEWVEKEWRRALARQKTKGGIPDIIPVPLDRNFPPPPPELSDLHFNDNLLFVCGEQGDEA